MNLLADITQTVILIVGGVLLIGVIFVMPFLSNRKRNTQYKSLIDSVKVGDIVKTIGGIIGTVKSITEISPVEKSFVLETGDGENKSTMTFVIQAIYEVVKPAAGPEQPDLLDPLITETAADAAIEAPQADPFDKTE